MSSPALIGFKYGKKLTYVGCTFDGHLDGVGKTIQRYWNDKDLANDLTSYANISELKNSFKRTVFYDPVNGYEKPQQVATVDEFVKTAISLDKKYWYVWYINKWYYGNALEEEFLFELDSLVMNSRKSKL